MKCVSACDAKTLIRYRTVCQSIVSVNEWFLRALKVLLRHSLMGHVVGIAHLPSVQLTPWNTSTRWANYSHFSAKQLTKWRYCHRATPTGS